MQEPISTPRSESRCEVVQLRRVEDPRGALCAAQVGDQIPFEIQRAYWVFDVPSGQQRAHHAHRQQHELLVAARGSFTVHCDDGAVPSSYALDSPDAGLHLPPMVFHHLSDFSAGALCLVLASGPYDWSEYVHDYEQFRELTAGR